nr:amino acid adenylation domain-containing protein [uncultured Cupriavidus sp.]
MTQHSPDFTIAISPRAHRDPVPLSFAQQRLWFLQRYAPRSVAYNLVRAFRLRGALSVPALERALQALATRHAVLRTRFVEQAGEPVQRIDAAMPSLTKVSVADDHHAVQALLQQEAARVFDLSSAPPVQFTVACIADDVHVLVMAMHHIVSDGWSNAILARDLALAYEAALNEAPPAWPELPIEYADYACWQRERLQGTALDGAMEAAAARIGNAVPALELPLDFARPATPAGKGARIRWTLASQTVEALRAYCASSPAGRLTPFAVLLAAWQALLARYSGQQDFAVGVPNAARTHEELDDLIGCFINTQIYRARLAPAMNTHALCAQIRDDARAALNQADLPFELLLDRIAPVRDPSRTPVFQAMFNLQMGDVAALSFAGLSVTALAVPDDSAKFDITLDLQAGSAGVRATLEYDAALFAPATIERMARHYDALLAAMLATPDVALDALPMLDTAERQEIVLQGNQTAMPLHAGDDVVRQFGASVATHAARIAVTGRAGRNEVALGYGALDAESNRIANWLHGRGIGPECLVGVCLPRTPELVAVLLGILKAGAAYLPIDASHPPQRNAHILAHAQPGVILATTQERAALGDAASVILLEGPTRPWHDASEAYALSDPHPEQLAYTLYTSGSTGTPKGVQISRGAFANFLLAMSAVAPLQPDDRLLAITTLGFDIAGLELFLPLVSGAHVVLASQDEARDPAQLAQLMTRHAISVMQATPATWQMLLSHDTPAWTGLRVLCGGEALGRELANGLRARGAQVLNVYGPTETTVWSAACRLGDGPLATAVAPVGVPIANNQLYVLDARMEPVPPGVAGELYIGGAGLARGYAADPARTAAAFVPNPFVASGPGAQAGSQLYRTGDMARKRADGVVEFLGRRDHQVKVRGFRVELGEVEAALAACQGVRHAACTVRRDNDGMGQLYGYYVADTDSPLDVAVMVPAMVAAMRQRVPGYMVPSRFMQLDSLPLNANGKVDRMALPEPAAAPRTVAPLRTTTEHELAALWSALLNVPELGADDDFFAHGGHSLLLVRLQARIRDTLHCELALPTLFGAPVLRDMAAAIDSTGRRDAQADVDFMNALLETL